ncbi:MAG: YhdP family protein [Psychromonas sp.]
MINFCCKWLKRFSALIALKLFLLAILLTGARILFISIDDYKDAASQWFAQQYNINISTESISAGVDFSGMILTLKNIKLSDTEELPFTLKIEHLFLHLNFWDSVKARNLNFNRISLSGVEVKVKESTSNSNNSPEQTSAVKNGALRKFLLSQLTQVSIKNSQVHFKNKLDQDKIIVIEQLQWLNGPDQNQGIGKAAFIGSQKHEAVEFVIDLYGDVSNPKQDLQGMVYIEADHLDVSEYVKDHVNPNISKLNAKLGLQVWAEFSNKKIQNAQVLFNNSQLSWVQQQNNRSLKIHSGLLQLTNSDNGWLLDTYDLDVWRDNKKWQDLSVTGYGDRSSAYFSFSELDLKHIIPIYLLASSVEAQQFEYISSFEVGGQLNDFAIYRDQQQQLEFITHISQFKNLPQGGIPGVSNADIELIGGRSKGELNISFDKQVIYFDAQFSRAMPVESAQLYLQWRQQESGFELFSEQSLLKTSELDTITEFSIFFPNEKAFNQSAFLSLYTSADLNDASKAQYYYPIQAMGDNVFNYLQPTLKKGHVKGAEILWYGAFNHYPYQDNNGVFQAWVPLRDAQYDFYGEWNGLKDLDLDLLFENDWLTMKAHRAMLDQVEIQHLEAKIDHLNPDGILSIDADITDQAQKISDYLKASPLKDSVGSALNVIELKEHLSGKLQLQIPFNDQNMQTQTTGTVYLSDNNVNLHLAEDLVLPLKELQGEFSFVNANLTATNMQALLFEQDVNLSFSSYEKDKTYYVDTDIKGVWKLERLNAYFPGLTPLQLSGDLDWSGNIDFSHSFAGDYQFTVALNSATQGVKSQLPAPFNKNALQSWPLDILVSGGPKNSTFKANLKDKLSFEGKLDYQDGKQSIPYSALHIGNKKQQNIDKNKQHIDISLSKLNIRDWYEQWLNLESDKETTSGDEGYANLINIDSVAMAIKHSDLFNQPLTGLIVDAQRVAKKWQVNIDSDNLQAKVEHLAGIPSRIDVNIEKLNFESIDFSDLPQAADKLSNIKQIKSKNLRQDYPELVVECKQCIYQDMDLSPLSLHVYPTKDNLIIEHIKVANDNESVEMSGVWDQKKTNLIVAVEAGKDNQLVERFGFTTPVVYRQGSVQFSGNWKGAPWEFNFESLNGSFSAGFKDGSITEVNDKGARLLSIFSLDGIRRSLNLEFGNVFSKGLNFDDFTLSGEATNGVVKNDDFYLNGSAGKIAGRGLVDLSNYDINYNFSYSPAVTSSLPVLTAFAINPLTGAAVLVLSKIFEPVVETIIRVDFTVKGPLDDPEVKLVTSKRGKVKLKNSEVLEEIEKKDSRSDR